MRIDILKYSAAVCAAMALWGCSSRQSVAIEYPGNSSNRVVFAAEHLDSVLQTMGYDVLPALEGAPEGTKVIRLSMVSDSVGPKEGFTITTVNDTINVIGNDGSGVIYGCREVIDRVGFGGSLDSVPAEFTDAPEMVLRGACVGVQKPYLLPGRAVYEYPYTPDNFPWFYDKELWVKYLDMLVSNRMNSLYLWNGHPFASLVKLEDYPFAIEVDDETFKKNEEMYSFITNEADKRGIFVIQMFYNILLSKPFAEHYGLKTQDRNRPISPLLSDYTRKSVAAFIEKYPNVGLLVCLGEAMDTYEDDVVWFTETIIPGVKDGLAKLGRTDEPPLLLRAHDTDCKMVMDAALPIYKNLYTMHKYNGESLTTYEPRGPWTEIHRGLSSLGSVHISNVHILANLEPWRWSSPDFTQKAAQAMHDVHGANALHLYPQASYWDWPYSADSIPGGRELQLVRDSTWYEGWGRYAWNCRRDRNDEVKYWNRRFARTYGLSDDQGAAIREAFEESGEIAPKLLRRFGITEGNRQTLLLGMFMSQLVNPYKYTIYPGFYESCGPEGEKLIEFAEKEHKGIPHVGELPLDITSQCVVHGDKAVEAIERLQGNVKANKDEFDRLSNDMHCYRLFAYFFDNKVKAAREVLNYQWTKDLKYLDAAVPYLEKSLDYYRQLVERTKGTYLYANSMQTNMRRIPIAGDGGKNKTWEELYVHYQKELENFRNNIAMLKDKAAGKDSGADEVISPLSEADVTVSGPWKRVKLTEGAAVLANMPDARVRGLAPELDGLTAFQVNGDDQRKDGTKIDFTCQAPVRLLVGYFKDDQKKYAKAPKLETDASANEYGQAEPVLTNAIHLEKMPLANVHAYSFNPGSHSLLLPKGYTLVLGFTSDEIKPRNAALAGADEAMDWLFY